MGGVQRRRTGRLVITKRELHGIILKLESAMMRLQGLPSTRIIREIVEVDLMPAKETLDYLETIAS